MKEKALKTVIRYFENIENKDLTLDLYFNGKFEDLENAVDITVTENGEVIVKTRDLAEKDRKALDAIVLKKLLSKLDKKDRESFFKMIIQNKENDTQDEILRITKDEIVIRKKIDAKLIHIIYTSIKRLKESVGEKNPVLVLFMATLLDKGMPGIISETILEEMEIDKEAYLKVVNSGDAYIVQNSGDLPSIINLYKKLTDHIPMLKKLVELCFKMDLEERHTDLLEKILNANAMPVMLFTNNRHANIVSMFSDELMIRGIIPGYDGLEPLDKLPDEYRIAILYTGKGVVVWSGDTGQEDKEYVLRMIKTVIEKNKQS